MSVEQFQNQAADVANNASNETVRRMGAAVNELTELFKTGQISKEEYILIMEDTARMAAIEAGTEHAQFLQNLNVAINGLVNLAKMV